MDEMKEFQQEPEELSVEVTPEEPAANAAPEQEQQGALFEPVIVPAAVTDDQLRFIGEQLNENWLDEFLQQKQAEEAEAAKEPELTAEEIVDEQIAAEGSSLVATTDMDWLTGAQPEEEEKEIGIDMAAAAAAGLVAPEDRLLESILAENWGDPEPEEESEPEVQEPAAPQEAFPVEEELPVELEEEPQEQPEEAQEEFPAEEAEPEADEEEENMAQNQKKRRPKMNKDGGFWGILFNLPHVLTAIVWLAIIVVIAVPLGRLLWMGVADLFAFGREPQEATVIIEADDTTEDVAQKLGDAGIIRYPWLFQKFADLTGKGERVDPGTYDLGSHLDYNALLNNMVNRGPAQQIVTVMFPEGYNCAQIFAKLEENGVCTVAELEEYAANGELEDYWFLEGVERGSKYCLEGYLSPDTYDFYTNDDPGRVLEKFLDAFDAHFSDIMKEDFLEMQERYNNALAKNGYSQSYIEANPLTLHKVVTLASIVQRETANDNESYTIASVFYNRLTDPSDHPYLGSDATVYYAIGDYFGENGELTSEQLQVDSPYNTRNSKGLPPGPICNPGAYSLYAALDPDETSYYYFIYSPNAGEHLFSTTLKEHEQKAEELGY